MKNNLRIRTVVMLVVFVYDCQMSKMRNTAVQTKIDEITVIANT